MGSLNGATVSQVRQPRGIVNVQGNKPDGSLDAVTRLNAWVSFEVTNNINYEADSFRVVFALSALPPAYSDSWWSTQSQIYLEIFAGFPNDAVNYTQSDLQSQIYGLIDTVDYDPICRTLTVAGRDLTSTMIDAKTTESFQNQTSSQIANTIAARHGLAPVVTKTTTTTGHYYSIDTLRVNASRSEWDILTALAGEEQMVVYVSRNSLHFEPAPAANATPYLLTWEPPNSQNGAFKFNGKRISFQRALTLAKGVVVQIISQNQRGQKITASYPKAAGSGQVQVGQASAKAQLYTYEYANLTQQQALMKAQQKHNEISKHEVKLSATLPADNLLQVSNIIQVIGTGTAYDQTYLPESITKRMDVQGGYEMEIKAKNHSPQSVIAL